MTDTAIIILALILFVAGLFAGYLAAQAAKQ